ncbi:MAG: DUF4350 domain-containing protein [Terriglobales bacterium]
MSLNLSRQDRKLFLGAGIIFVLLVVSALVFGSGEQGQAEYPSSYSSASGGAKAAYLLLSETGYKVKHWERPLSDLPQDAAQDTAKTLILAEPNEAPTREERERLKAFISEGGHVIATGMFAGTFLPENESVPDVFSGMTWKTVSSLSPSQITRVAPQIVLAPRAYWSPFSVAYPLYGDGNHVVVVKYPFGRGEVLWWAAATPLTNAGLKEQGNLEFFLACLGDRESASKNEILFDEYIHGYRETLGGSIAHSPVMWLLLQLALLAMAVVATFSRRSGPICLPTTEVRLSPIEFVQTLGGLYERAGTAAIVVDICYRRFRYWLTRRFGVASNTSAEEMASVVRDRWAFTGDRSTGDQFIATLKHCEAASSNPFLQPPMALHLLQELDGYAAQLNLYQGIRKEKGE